MINNLMFILYQACSQTTNTVGAAASSVGEYMYICLYMYIMLLYINCVYIVCMHKRNEYLCQDHKLNT